MIKKIKTTSFWVGLSGVVVMLVDSVSGLLGISLSSDKAGDVVLSICAILILFGVVTKKTEDDDDKNRKELLDEINDDLD